ncbi:type IV pilus twitching motility protein PilT [Larsenimonas suaedae]|uniref:Type IV pilus twitching motility protein PilT n=1 Tax=Larsenimonas suaedae TaxID=1851019 RepID=A0ABU1GZT5_9GAMM|nr:type IV pilus twitching motility protein PilT [Larsenimonas suaedae]MCM2973613.1 type IV pilus twitching motility protein PilT [Larsenimonas suaedae]MDR5897017.1 type IV pilus twitching motility protein PilT [Larsenimonas suaedae]
MDITELLAFSAKQNASDLHLSAGLPPMIRVDGDVRRINVPALEDKDVRRLTDAVMTDQQRRQLDAEFEVDFSFALANVARFRANVFLQDRGMAGVFRMIPDKVPSMDELAYPDVFRKLSGIKNGLVLVTGPTGSGKSTTLAAMLDYINASRYEHILTIEDPIEFVFEPKRCLISQREVGRDTKTVAAALRAALREDPDVIMVGELRDLETIRLALTAAETGHVVFGTLHTTSAAKTIDRIVDVFPGDEKAVVRSMLSESVQGIVSQQLLKRIGGGRIAAHEVLVATPAIRNLIRENKVSQIYSAIQTGTASGMQTMEHAVTRLKQQGLVVYDD